MTGLVTLREWAYFRNNSDTPRTIQHPLLATGGGLVSVVPGGLALVNGVTLTIEPGQIVKLPISVFCDVAIVQDWGREVSEADWLEAISRVQQAAQPGFTFVVRDEPEPEPEPELEPEPIPKRRGRPRKADG